MRFAMPTAIHLHAASAGWVSNVERTAVHDSAALGKPRVEPQPESPFGGCLDHRNSGACKGDDHGRQWFAQPRPCGAAERGSASRASGRGHASGRCPSRHAEADRAGGRRSGIARIQFYASRTASRPSRDAAARGADLQSGRDGAGLSIPFRSPAERRPRAVADRTAEEIRAALVDAGGVGSRRRNRLDLPPRLPHLRHCPASQRQPVFPPSESSLL